MFSNDNLVLMLSFLRKTMELEGGTTCLEIDVDLATALTDVCEALHLSPSQICSILGDKAYNAIYSEPKDPWTDLRAEVRAVYSRSHNVTIFDNGY